MRGKLRRRDIERDKKDRKEGVFTYSDQMVERFVVVKCVEISHRQ